jgi:hypothetical protein
MPLYDRAYRVGDRVLMLGKGSPQGEMFPAIALPSSRLTSARETWGLLEGRVAGFYGDGAENNVMMVHYQHRENARAGDGVGERTAEYYLSNTGVANFVERTRDALVVSRLDQEPHQFLKQFIYPVVVATAGYRSMLLDMAKIMGREEQVPLIEDAEAIKRKALEYGFITRAFLLGDAVGRMRDLNDRTTRMIDNLETQLAVAAPPVDAAAPVAGDVAVPLARGANPAAEDIWNAVAQQWVPRVPDRGWQRNGPEAAGQEAQVVMQYDDADQAQAAGGGQF